MSSNLVQVNWESRPNVLCNKLGSYRSQKILADVVLSCEGESFHAHRLVLSLSSGYFRKSLMSAITPAAVVMICGMKKDVLDAILGFIYDGTVTLKSELIPDLLKAGILFEIPGLMDMGNNYDRSEKNDDEMESESQDNFSVFNDSQEIDNLHNFSDPGTNFQDTDLESNQFNNDVPSSEDAVPQPEELRKSLHSVRTLQCPEMSCNKKCFSSAELAEHMLTHSLNFKCPKCFLEISNQRHYLLHLRRCEKEHEEKNGDLRSARLPSKSKNQPKRARQDDSDSENDSNRFKATDSDNDTNQSSNKVNRPIQSVSNINLVNSIGTVSQKACSHCSRSFVTITKYKKHRGTDCKMVQCHFCLQEFSQNSLDEYKDHLESHQYEIEPFSCPKCSFRCKEVVDLEDHFSVHTGVYRFWCPLCDFQTTKMNELEDHTTVHPQFSKANSNLLT